MAALSAVLGEAAAGLVAGEDLSAVLAQALAGVQSDPALAAAVGVTVSEVVGAVLGDGPAVSAVGAVVAEVISAVSGSAAVRELAAEQVAGVVAGLVGGPAGADLGVAVGAAVAGVLADRSVMGLVSRLAATVVPDFVGQPGVVAALSAVLGEAAAGLVAGQDVQAVLAAVVAGLRGDAALAAAVGVTLGDALTVVLRDTGAVSLAGSTAAQLITAVAASPAARELVAEQLATAILAGGDLSGLASVIAALQTNPALVDALSASARSMVWSVLGRQASREGLAEITGLVVVDLMKQSGINLGFINGVVGQVAKASVSALLADLAVWNLMGDTVDNVLAGKSVNEVLNSVVGAVIRDTQLQAAIGYAVGRGIGSLFGDSPFGDLVGRIVAVAATVQIALVAGIVRLFTGDKPIVVFPVPAAGASIAAGERPHPRAAAAQTTSPAGGDLYVMTATLPSADAMSAIRQNLAGPARFTLDQWAVNLSDGSAEPGYLDIAVTVTDGSPEATVNDDLFVALRFRLDRLFPAVLSVPAVAARPASFASID